MKHTPFHPAFWIAPLLASWTSCGKDEPRQLPVSRQVIAQTAETNLRNITNNLTNSLSFLAESDAVAASLSQVSSCEAAPPASSCSPDDPTCTEPPVAGSEPPVAGSPGCDAATMKADLASLNGELQNTIDEWVMKVRTEIFADANIESESPTAIVYRLPLSLVCETGNNECANQFALSQPRLRVTSPSEGDIDVALLMTANKFQPATVLLHKTKLGVRIDLAEVKNSMAVIEPDSVAEISRMAGVIELALVKNAERNFSFTGEIKRAIDVAIAPTSPDPFELFVNATDKTYELRLDGVAKTITASVNVGAMRVAVPLDTVGETLSTNMPDILRILIGGLNGSLTFNGNTDTLALKGLGLGNQTTTVRVNNHEVVALDVNKNANRRFDMTISMAETNTPVLSFAPGLDVSAKFNFQPIASRFSQPLPAYLIDDTLGLQLSGTNPSLRLREADVQILSGTLTLTSTAVPAANITVAAGQCLAQSTAAEPQAHELLSSLTARMCD